MLEMELLTEKDLVYSAKMYSDYQKNAFLLDRLLVTNTANIAEFCHLLQNTESQQDIGDMLINGKSIKSCFVLHKYILPFLLFIIQI